MKYDSFIKTEFGRRFCDLFNVRNEAEFKTVSDSISEEMREEPSVMHFLCNATHATTAEIDSILV